MPDIPPVVIQAIQAILAVFATGIIAQWGAHKLAEINGRWQREAKLIDSENLNKEREGKVETGLRAELLLRIERQDAKILELTDRDERCTRNLIRMQQWLWTLHAALDQAGVTIALPSDLTLEGFEQPVIPRPNLSAAPVAHGAEPDAPGMDGTSPAGGSPMQPPTRPMH